jgi:hypothetical protein
MGLRRVLVAIAMASVVACSSFSSEPEAALPPCDGGACASDAASAPDTSPSTPPVDCLVAPASPNDPETCKCGSEGITQACSLGIVGAPSACQGSTQRCTLTDGVLRWSACTGATKPAAKETCFDAVDDDCDGKLNNGCACVDVPLCKDAMGVELTGDTLILEKTTVKSGEKISVFLLSRSPLGSTWLTTTNGPQTLCGGGGGSVPCATSGCAGWNVERREIDTTLNPAGGIFRAGTGSYTIKMRRGLTDAPGLCTGGPNTASAQLQIN